MILVGKNLNAMVGKIGRVMNYSISFFVDDLNKFFGCIFRHVSKSGHWEETGCIGGKEAGDRCGNLIVREIKDVIKGNPRQGIECERKIASRRLRIDVA